MKEAVLVAEIVASTSLAQSFQSDSPSRVRRILTSSVGTHTSELINRSGLQPSWESWWRSFLLGSTAHSTSARVPRLNVVDLFCSAGGLSLGVREAARALDFQFESVLAADLDGDALATYKANFPTTQIVNKSVRALVDYQIFGEANGAEFGYQPQAIDEASDYLNPDLVVGGPPCQGHSSLNNYTRGDDFRNDLYLTMPAFALATGAKTVIIENVPRVVHDSKKVVATSIRLLQDAGYWVTSGVMAADDLGWGQTRSRHFLIASRISEPRDIDTVANMLRQTPSSIWWLISDLEDAVEADNLMLSTPKMSEENLKRVQWLFDNDAYELPDHIRPDCHKDGHTYPSVYGRLHKDSPSPTLTTGFQTPGRGRYIHPTRRRVLTVREAARIQGFPDTFAFAAASGRLTRGMLQKWIGDAVPSILGYTAGLIALETLK